MGEYLDKVVLAASMPHGADGKFVSPGTGGGGSGGPPKGRPPAVSPGSVASSGAKVYTHPSGSTIVVSRDGHVRKFGADGKPRPANYSAETLAKGRGKWKESSPASVAATDKAFNAQGRSGIATDTPPSQKKDARKAAITANIQKLVVSGRIVHNPKTGTYKRFDKDGKRLS